MSGAPTGCQYFRVYVFRPLWRRKWCILLLILSFALIIASFHHLFSKPADLYDDAKGEGFSEEIYGEVLSRWYNITSEDAWYNVVFPTREDKPNWERYIDHLRRHWIEWAYDPEQSYNLRDPLTEDPSAGQASVIRAIFNDKKDGFFVECGAYDGETRSNTLVLERVLNWTGLLIEADPINFSKMLQKNRKAYLSPTCLAIQPYPSVSSFLMANNVGRLHDLKDSDYDQTNSPDVAHHGRHVLVQCIPFADLITALNVTTVDYFSLDIEGYEFQVLKTIPFDEIDIKSLSVEFSHMANDVEELNAFMESKGYEVYLSVIRDDHFAHDMIYVKRDKRKRDMRVT